MTIGLTLSVAILGFALLWLDKKLREAQAELATEKDLNHALRKNNQQLEKAVESYRSEVEPLKALADGLGKQLAAMGRKK
jgi:citrate synthase